MDIIQQSSAEKISDSTSKFIFLKKVKMTITVFFSMILGILLLFFGRRLFWLFVGVAGFIAGLTLVPQLISGQSELTILLIAIVAGIIGAILAIMLEGLAILIAGFLAGGYLMTTLVASFRLFCLS